MSKHKEGDITKMTPLHYLVGGLAGVFISYLIYGELNPILVVFSFVAFPLVFVFGFFMLIVNIIGFLFGLIF